MVEIVVILIKIRKIAVILIFINIVGNSVIIMSFNVVGIVNTAICIINVHILFLCHNINIILLKVVLQRNIIHGICILFIIVQIIMRIQI